jgi:rubrerythrin
VVCPYCKGEVIVGTAYDALSSLTGALTREAQNVQTMQDELSDDLKQEANDLKRAFREGSAAEIQEKMDDLRDALHEMSGTQAVSKMSISFVLKSCPHCGSSVQVSDGSCEVTECPHCGFSKGNGEKDG